MISRDGDRWQVSGRLTMETVGALLNLGAPPTGQTEWVVDLARVEVVDSAAVGLLLAWLRAAGRSRVQLRFAHVPQNLLSLARLYGVADLLPLCGNKADS